MLNIKYIRPKSLKNALANLQETEFDNVLLAGGTDLLIGLRNSDQPLKRMVDISRLEELKIIKCEGSRITIGSGVTFSEILNNEILQKNTPLLVEACSRIGGPQVRNRGTIGGNIVNAAVCADSLPALVCLETEAHFKANGSNRHMKVADFISGKNQTQIKNGEILTHFICEAQKIGVRSCFIKLGRRNAMAIARISVAVMGRLNLKGQVDLIRIAIGAATTRIERWSKAEDCLLGKIPDPEIIKDCGRMISEQMIEKQGRRWSTEYKEQAIAKLIERALGRIFLQVPEEDGGNLA